MLMVPCYTIDSYNNQRNKFVCVAMCSLVMSPCSHDVITIHGYGSKLTGLTCSKAPGFWMVEHQLVYMFSLHHIVL